MALSVKIQGLPRDDGKPIWSLDHVNWWRARELVTDPRFRSIQEGGYQDHVAVLSPLEALELCDRYRERGARLDPEEVTLLGVSTMDAIISRIEGVASQENARARW